MNHFDNISIATLETAPPSPVSHDWLGQQPSYSTCIEYFNYTGKDLVIIDRHGVKTRVASMDTYNVPRQGLYVVKSWRLTPDSVKINRVEESNARPEEKAIEEAFNQAASARASTYRRFETSKITYEIKYEQLNHQGSIYFRNLDIVVAIANAADTTGHPYEFRFAGHVNLVQNPDINRRDTFAIAIKLVDKNGVLGERYVNINGRVFKVPWSDDPKMADGIYVDVSEEVFGRIRATPPPSTTFYTFDEYATACKNDPKMFTLYETIDLARSLGDLQSERKERLDALAHERKLREEEVRQEKQARDVEFERMKHQHAMELQEANKLLSDMETFQKREALDWNLQLEKAKRETERVKAHYADNAMHRKAMAEEASHQQSLEKLRSGQQNEKMKLIEGITKNVVIGLTAIAAIIPLVTNISKAASK